MSCIATNHSSAPPSNPASPSTSLTNGDEIINGFSQSIKDVFSLAQEINQLLDPQQTVSTNQPSDPLQSANLQSNGPNVGQVISRNPSKMMLSLVLGALTTFLPPNAIGLQEDSFAQRFWLAVAGAALLPYLGMSYLLTWHTLALQQHQQKLKKAIDDLHNQPLAKAMDVYVDLQSQADLYLDDNNPQKEILALNVMAKDMLFCEIVTKIDAHFKDHSAQVDQFHKAIQTFFQSVSQLCSNANSSDAQAYSTLAGQLDQAIANAEKTLQALPTQHFGSKTMVVIEKILQQLKQDVQTSSSVAILQVRVEERDHQIQDELTLVKDEIYGPYKTFLSKLTSRDLNRLQLAMGVFIRDIPNKELIDNLSKWIADLKNHMPQHQNADANPAMFNHTLVYLMQLLRSIKPRMRGLGIWVWPTAPQREPLLPS